MKFMSGLLPNKQALIPCAATTWLLHKEILIISQGNAKREL